MVGKVSYSKHKLTASYFVVGSRYSFLDFCYPNYVHREKLFLLSHVISQQLPMRNYAGT